MKKFTLLAIGLACGLAASAQTLTPQQVLVDLSPWKLTLPVDDTGGTAGKAASVSSAKLVAGYSNPSYFHTIALGSTNHVEFWCPSNGATTSPGTGSDHPRTELLEANGWRISRGGTLFARAQVLQYPPSTGDIIIGQIHGGAVTENGVTTSYASAPFVMLHVRNGQMFIVVKGTTSGNTGTVQKTLFTNVALNQKIVYKLRTDGTRIYVAASCANATPDPSLTPTASGTVSWSVLVPTPWQGLPVRFAAGAYVQDVSSSSTDGGRMAFSELTLTNSAAGRSALLAAAPASTLTPDFQLYPTTVSTQLAVAGPTGSSLTIADALGRVALRHTLAQAETTVPVASLPAGIYYATLLTPTGRQVQRFVKE
ncbi:polysaccharide lyase family 7 protein [Hymenobacter negativus]|uniref:Polysaccharide lyase family 7 protein n=1 Tax=Hymenobacter negativus TaxID=2795026 RepID=A0ABS3QJT8_9BACT|nr:polysaccharide lyase family 7 protein [Hymenobacter negativus]MBO2011521.1 polysaccharide lyase family 7 protein [Hymenobacter negativus]